MAKKAPVKKTTSAVPKRTGYRAYTVTLTGTGSQSRYSIILRPKQLPISIDDLEFREMLPRSVTSFSDNREEAILLIDAFYDVRLSYLIARKEQHPTLVHGFEKFLEWSERKAGKAGRTLDRINKFLVLPEGSPKRVPFNEAFEGSIKITTTVLIYEGNDPYLEVSFEDKSGCLMTKLYLDVDSRKYKIVDHYPNLYHFLNIPPSRPWALLGLSLKGLDPDRRMGYHSHWDRVESEDAKTSPSNK